MNHYEFASGTRNRKLWGIQQFRLHDTLINVDYIEVVPGGYCSVHLHKNKANIFIVKEGSMEIFEFSPGMAVIRAGKIEAGESATVQAGVLHQFWSPHGCIAQEVYYGTADEPLVVHEDIVRLDGFELGGVSTLLAGVPSMKGVFLAEAGS